MKVEIRFEKAEIVNYEYDSCDVKIHERDFRFFKDHIFCYNNSKKMEIKMKKICQRLNRKYEWDW